MSLNRTNRGIVYLFVNLGAPTPSFSSSSYSKTIENEYKQFIEEFSFLFFLCLIHFLNIVNSYAKSNCQVHTRFQCTYGISKVGKEFIIIINVNRCSNFICPVLIRLYISIIENYEVNKVGKRNRSYGRRDNALS